MCKDMCMCVQLCPTLCNPLDQPLRLFCPWNFSGKYAGVGCHFLLQGSSWPRNWNCLCCVYCIGRQILYHWLWASYKNPTPPFTSSVTFSSVHLLIGVRLSNPMDCSVPGLPVHHQLPGLAQTHVYQVGDAIQPSHSLSSPSPPAFNLSQHQDLFKWVSSSHQVARVVEFQL